MRFSNLDHPRFGPSDIWKARRRLQHAVWHTPLVFSPALSRRTNNQVYPKTECWPVCGCLKARGAINLVSALSEARQSRGLVTASAGNHGIALAFAAARCGGLIPGIAMAVRPVSRKVKIFGIEPSAAPAAYTPLQDGVCCEEIEIKPSLADGY
jgi:threonine dehydratase